MNKVVLVGRLVKNPDIFTTTAGIKYTRFTIAVSRPFVSNQSDFIPIIAWRSQAEFVEKYLESGALVSIDGRFSSSTYENNDKQKVSRYEVTAERVQGLESKANIESRKMSKTNELTVEQTQPTTSTLKFEDQSNIQSETDHNEDVPWDFEL